MMEKIFFFICLTFLCSSCQTLSQIGCGFRNPAGLLVTEIGNSSIAEFGEFPWTAEIIEVKKIDNKTEKLYACGAVLIAPKAILTAAHCIRTLGNFVVRAGDWDRFDTYAPLLPQDRETKVIIIHSDNRPENNENDIALVILETPFELQRHIQPICLPNKQNDYENSNCFVSSWGTSDGTSTLSTKMKKTQFNVIPKIECEKTGKKLFESQLCAGKENNRVCKGDSGAPLACPIPGASNRYYLAGVLSFGDLCSNDYKPAVFSNLTFYREWIDRNLSKYGIQTEDYSFVHSMDNNTETHLREF